MTMSTLENHLAFPQRWARACVLAGGLSALAGCSDVPERGSYEIDCFPEGIELDDTFMSFEETVEWWSAGDNTPRSNLDEALDPMPVPIEGGRCGSSTALHLVSYGHNDWGSAFGTYSLALAPVDGSEWDGLAIWARAERNTTRAVRLLVVDRYGSESGTLMDPELGEPSSTCVPPPGGDTVIEEEDEERICYTGVGGDVPCEEDEMRICYTGVSGEVLCEVVAVRQSDQTTEEICSENDQGELVCEERIVQDPEECYQNAEGLTVCGDESGTGPHECGNAFSRVFEFSNRWELHLLPWDSFYQDPLPNRRKTGIDTTAIHGLTIAVPREAVVDLQIDDLTFYRRTQ